MAICCTRNCITIAGDKIVLHTVFLHSKMSIVPDLLKQFVIFVICWKTKSYSKITMSLRLIADKTVQVQAKVLD